jgi:hypothetical protein
MIARRAEVNRSLKDTKRVLENRSQGGQSVIDVLIPFRRFGTGWLFKVL